MMSDAWWNEGGKLCMWWDLTNYHIDPTLLKMGWDEMSFMHRFDFMMTQIVTNMIMHGEYSNEDLTLHLLYYEDVHPTGGRILPWLRNRQDGIATFLKVWGGLYKHIDPEGKSSRIISPVKPREGDPRSALPLEKEYERRAQEIPPTQEGAPTTQEMSPCI